MELLIDENSALAKTNLRALLLDASVWNLLSPEQVAEIYQYWPREPGCGPPKAAATTTAPTATTAGAGGGGGDGDSSSSTLLPCLLAQLTSNDHLRHDIAEYQTALGTGKHDAEWIRQARAAHVLREQQRQEQQQQEEEKQEPEEGQDGPKGHEEEHHDQQQQQQQQPDKQRRSVSEESSPLSSVPSSISTVSADAAVVADTIVVKTRRGGAPRHAEDAKGKTASPSHTMGVAEQQKGARVEDEVTSEKEGVEGLVPDVGKKAAEREKSDEDHVMEDA